jgi:hypothetical protein
MPYGQVPSEVRYSLHNGRYETPTQYLYKVPNIDLLQASTKTSYSRDFIPVIFPNNGPLTLYCNATLRRLIRLNTETQTCAVP